MRGDGRAAKPAGKVAKGGSRKRPRGKRPTAAEARRRALVVFRGVVRRWPDEETAKRAGISLRTLHRYRSRLKGGLPFMLDPAYLRSQVAETMLQIEDCRGEALERLETARDHMTAARLLSVLIYSVRAKVSIIRLLGAFDKQEKAGERFDPTALKELVKLPLDRRRAEAAKRIEMLRERLEPSRWQEKMAELEAKDKKPDDGDE